MLKHTLALIGLTLSLGANAGIMSPDPSLDSTSALTLNLEGVVTQVDPIFSSLVSIGDSMAATFVYDPSLITSSSEFETDRYFYYSPLVEYEVSMGDVYAQGTGGRSEVSNNHIDSFDRVWDRFILQTGGVSYPSIPSLEALFDINALSVGMSLYDYVDADALTTSQPLESIPLELFDLGRSHVTIQMEVDGGDFDWQPMFARLTNAEITTLSAVPNPATIPLICIALAGLGWSRRRKA